MSIMTKGPHPKVDIIIEQAGGEVYLIDFKVNVPSVQDMARQIAAFANAAGGVIVVGIREERRGIEVVGCDVLRLGRVVEEARHRITPPLSIRVDDMDVADKKVGLVRIGKADPVVLADLGAYIRDGGRVRPMSGKEIIERLDPFERTPEVQALADAVARQTEVIE